MKVEILNYGGIIQSVLFPDRNGEENNVVLGFRHLDEYVKDNSAPTPTNPDSAGPYFGALVGRFANRVTGGRLEVDGAEYRVPVNEGPNALHGGEVGFDQKVWHPTVVRGESTVGLALEYVSPAGEMGFPGTLSTVATYTLDNYNRLTLTFQATTDATTLVNLTNHTYWNLAGESGGPIYDHVLHINADRYSPVDEALLPTGELLPVEGTAFDFRNAAPIGERIRDADPQLIIGGGYDLNWVLNQTSPGSLVLAATVTDPKTGRGLKVHTTQPGIQFYSGNFLNGKITGSGGRAYRQSDGFALETQHFPDAPNHPNFPSTTLRPGERFEETTIFELFCDR
jgi:aldose 1-epimerase